MENKECPFCNIDSNITKILDENENAFVVLSNPRKVKGHLLVIPKNHVEKIQELNEAEWKSIIDLLIKYQKKITENLSEGSEIRQNCMPYVSQNKVKVDHVHFHIFPRDFNDEMFYHGTKQESELFADLNEEEIKEVFEKLKQ